jgi:stage II sporulation protein D
VKLRALVAASLLVLIVVVVVQASPGRRPAAPPAALAPFLQREPVIRVRIATLEPGEQALVIGVAGRGAAGVTVANRAGVPEVGGAPCETACTLAAETDGEISIGGRRYHGDVAVLAETEPGRVHLVNRLPIEQYLEGVVLSEMPPDYPDEALLAQSVASRSYAAWQMTVRRDRLWDVTDTQRSQVYRGAPAHLELARRVVRSTRGQVLSYGGTVLEAVFSSTCGGATRSAEEAFGDESPAPLRGVACGLCDGTQFSRWTAKIGRAEAGRVLLLGGPVEELLDATLHPSGRLAAVTVRGRKGQKALTGNQARDLFGPAGRSTWFTALEIRGEWIFADGRGFGHGAGMCQVGASKLASAGRNHQAILAHYYPGASLAWLYPVHES